MPEILRRREPGAIREEERGLRLQVAHAFVDERLVPALAGRQKQLASDDAGARGAVEDVEELEVPVAAREHVLVDDVHVADDLSVRARIDGQAELRERFLDGLSLEAAKGLHRFGPRARRQGEDQQRRHDRGRTHHPRRQRITPAYPEIHRGDFPMES